MLETTFLESLKFTEAKLTQLIKQNIFSYSSTNATPQCLWKLTPSSNSHWQTNLIQDSRHILGFANTPTPTEGFFLLSLPFPPPRNTSLVSYFASRIWAFKTSLPLRFSNDLQWGGYGYFLELHNLRMM